ncbi:MAG TPA: flagellin [Bryobacteraceae bacterium]|nr:flagellin [Bryobacteraceae bacterium]
MISLQTNVASLVAQQNLNVDQAFQTQTITQLTSGYRINSSGDDAAGLAVANGDRDQVAQLTQGVANGTDAVAQLQIMDGGMSNISQILDRLQTLATESASGAFTGNRTTLNNEFQTDIQELDRQAQSIGLNTGGTFAKDLSIYLGEGSGSQSVSNAVVNVDLSTATVDSTSLGLTNNQAVNANTYDLGSSSATSVSSIISDAANQAQNIANSNSAESAVFTFAGQGFGGNNAVSVTVNLAGVTDTNSLVTAINAAITNQGNESSAADAALKAAGITASIVTDSNGNQKLAFNSRNAFQVTAGDNMANALMGNFNISGQTVNGQTATVATGQSADSTATGTTDLTSGINASTNNIVLTFTNTATSGGIGGTSSNTVTLNQNYTSAAAVAQAIQSQIDNSANLKNAGLSVSVVNNKLLISSRDGQIKVEEDDASSGTTLGLPGAASPTGTATATTNGTSYATYVASGVNQLGSAGSATDLDFTSLANTGDSQNITITADDSTGVAHSYTVTLSKANGDTSTAAAVQDINSQLQASGNSTLQQITAVVSNDGGAQKINFISNLSNFSISVASGTGGEGISVPSSTGALDSQNAKVSSTQVGAGGSVDISTQAGAEAAVAAIGNAVQALGSAQAAVGKGENQLNYAINLANSQITNISVAESDIMDANVAQEAANLSKAQVLNQAAVAAMAQANSAPQVVLSLLRG